MLCMPQYYEIKKYPPKPRAEQLPLQTTLPLREKSITKAKGRAVTPANCPATKAHVIPACNQTALSKVTISVMLICMKGYRGEYTF